MSIVEPNNSDQRPVVLLLGAKGKSTKQSLHSVQSELESIRAIFEPYAEKNHKLLRLSFDTNLTQVELKSYLDQFAGKVSVLHFAGHSDSEMLQTDDLQVYADRIADIINVWSSPPDLIFLNGCHNEGQVEAFHNAGVPVVIATSQKVNDATAANFACEFYRSLVGSDEASLRSSFIAAKKKLQLSSSDEDVSAFILSEENRSPNLDTAHSEDEQTILPWLLYAQVADQEEWTLNQLLTQERPVLGDDRQPVNPYKGLAAFTEDDKNFFFGRESLIDDLAGDIKKSPLVTLMGASGSGKSSLVSAGVIPKLSQDKEWQFITTKPGNDPFAELASALSEAVHTSEFSVDECETELRKEKGLLRYCSEYFVSRQQKVLLVIDQFEELFTQSAPDVVEAFQQQLYALVEEKLVNCHVLLVMRADFLSKAIQNANFARLLNRNLDKKLAPMDEAELRAAINSPARSQRVSIEPALLETLIDAVENQPGSLPLLQDILHQLWGVRSSRHLILLDEYNQLGGLKKALGNRADNVLQSFSKDHQLLVQEIFLRLIQPGSGTEDTRRRAYLKEFKDNPVTKGVLQQLVNERLVMTQQTKDDDASVEITHEALISNWGSLAKWIESDRDNLRTQHQLSKAAKEWEEGKGDTSWLMTGSRLIAVEEWFEDNSDKANVSEKQFFNTSIDARKRKKRRNYSIVSGVIVTLSLIAGIAVWQWYDAEHERNRATQERDRAFNQINTANKLIDNIQGDLRDKLQVINRLDIMSGVQKAVAEYHSDSSNIIKGTTGDLLINSRRQNVRNQVDGADILFNAGNVDKALEAYNKALIETINISHLVPNDSKWKSNVGVISLKIAQVHIQRKEHQIANDYSQKSLSLMNDLLASEPDNLSFRRDRVSAYESLGTVHKSASMYVKALEYYVMGLQEINDLSLLDPSSVDYINVKIVLLSHMSAVYKTSDDMQKNAKLIEDNLDEIGGSISDEQKKMFLEAKSKVTYPCSKNCLKLALDGHLESLSAMVGLVEKHPKNNLFYQKSVLMYQDVANTYHSMRDDKNANKYHQLFISHSQELLRRNPGHAEHHLLIAQGYFSQGNRYRGSNKFDLSKKQYAEGLAIVEKLLSNDPNNTTFQRVYQGQSIIYNSLDASKQAYELMKEHGMIK